MASVEHPIHYPDVCYGCRGRICELNVAMVGWCIDCVDSHPGTKQLVLWAHLYDWSRDELMDQLAKRFLACWN